jgi:hypothetical protein
MLGAAVMLDRTAAPDRRRGTLRSIASVVRYPVSGYGLCPGLAHRVVRGTATSRQLLRVKWPQPVHRGSDANDPKRKQSGGRIIRATNVSMTKQPSAS